MYLHSFWASLRFPGDSPARAGPPGGFRGSEKTLYFASFRRAGGFRGLVLGFIRETRPPGLGLQAGPGGSENFVLSQVLYVPAASGGGGENLVFSQLLGFIRETRPPGLGLQAGPGGSENFVLSQVLYIPAASGAAKHLHFHRVSEKSPERSPGQCLEHCVEKS